jgi:hypothetical protein
MKQSRISFLIICKQKKIGCDFGLTPPGFVSPRINSRFPDILVIFPKHQLFQRLKTLPEYLGKSGNPHSIFHKIQPTNGSFFSGKCRGDAW